MPDSVKQRAQLVRADFAQRVEDQLGPVTHSAAPRRERAGRLQRREQPGDQSHADGGADAIPSR